MGSSLPALQHGAFLARLTASSQVQLDEGARERLWCHYQELERWNPVLSLVGPGTAEAIVERHYGEALAGVGLVPSGARVLVDVGSGAGFPGFVLAAARPDLDVTLVESNARKWAFLEAARRRAALPCRCLNVRVATPLPEDLPLTMDLLTARALKLEPIVEALESRLVASARILFWAGGDDRFGVPRGWRICREVPLAGSSHRRIVELGRA